MPKLPEYELPPGYSPILPQGYTPIAPGKSPELPAPVRPDGENIVTKAGRGLASMFPSATGAPGTSMADTLNEAVVQAGQQTQRYLGLLLGGEKALFGKNFAENPSDPQARVTGNDLAAGALSPEAGRAAVETGAGMLATAPLGGAGGWGPALARTALGAAGGAAGSLLSEGFNPTPNPGRSAAAAALSQGAGQGLTETVASLIGGTQLEKGGEAAVNALAARGGSITPGQVSKAGAVDAVQNIAAHSAFGGPMIGRAQEKSANLATSLVTEYVDQYAQRATKAETGQMLVDALGNSRLHFDSVMDAGYRALDKVAGGQMVSYAPIKKLAAQIAGEADQGVGGAGLRKLATDILNRPDQVPFTEARTMLRSLKAVSGDTADIGMADAVEAAGQRLGGVLQGDIDKAALTGLTPDGYKFYKGLNQAYAEGAETFNSKLIKSVATKDPEAFFNYAVKSNNAFNVARLRKVVSDDATWGEVQGQTMKDLVEKASTADGSISGAKLAEAIKEGGSFGGEKFRAAFSPKELEAFRSVVDTLKFTQAPLNAKSTFGGMAIQFAQAGAFGGLLTSGLVIGSPGLIGSGAVILAGPAIAARLLTNKAVAKALTVGLKAPAGSRLAANAFAHVAAAAAQHGASIMNRQQYVPQEQMQ